MRTVARRSEAARRGGSSRARAPAGGAPAGRGAPLRHKARVPTTCSRARSVHIHIRMQSSHAPGTHSLTHKRSPFLSLDPFRM
jgi:hypothetical protein